MAQEERELTYEKRADAADMAGEDYELQLCALLVVRAATHCPRGFYLASNHSQAGSFDDIVLFWRQEVDGGGAAAWRGMLLQLKHKQAEALGRKVFLPAPQDQKKAKGQGRKTPQANFSLVDYYDSYRQKVRPAWQQMVSKIGDVPLEQVTVGIFTNTGVKKMDIRDVNTAPDIVDTGAVRDAKEISRITEVTFSLEEEDVGCCFSTCEDLSDAGEFLSRFRLFCNQASLEKLQQLIKDELMAALGTGPGESTDGACAALLAGVKAWWTAKKAAPYLTADSALWTDIVLAQLADLGDPLSGAVRALGLTFTPEATDPFSRVFSTAPGRPVVVVCERGCGLLSAGKALQALQPDRGLAVTAEAAERRLPEVAAALASRACRWLLLLQPHTADPLSAAARSRLLDELRRHPKTLVLVTDADGVPPDATEGWTRHDDQFSLLQLDTASQERLLQKTVIFQGLDTTVGDIVQGDGAERVRRAAQLLGGLQVLRLLSGGPPAVGAALRDGPRYFVERPLERRRELRDDVVLAPPPGAALAAGATFFRDAMKSGGDSPPPVVLLQGREWPDAQFDQLCEKWGTAGRSLHWLSWQDGGTWRWERSVGDTWALRGHLAGGGWSAEWARDALEAAPGERAVVLEGPPGIGKSTLLAHLAAAAKRRLPHALVVVVELGRYSRELLESPFLDAGSVKKLLKLAAKIDDAANDGLDGAIFDFCLDVTGEAVVVLDGFDEISHYEEQFDKLEKGAAALRALLDKTRVRKVWASTRPATCRPIEEAARVLAFQLRGFSAREQHKFFTLFLESTGANAHLPQVLRQVEALQERTSLRRQALSFLEVPLHAAMLAEVATGEDGSQVLSDGAIDLCRLYETFFNKKADIYQLEKRKMALHESHTGWEAAAGRDAYQETIIVFALRGGESFSVGCRLQVPDGALTAEDRVLRWRPLQYADLHGAWEVADALLASHYSPGDLAHTRDRLQRAAPLAADLLRAFVAKG
ncbi:uncharacterized protein LOC124795569 [Schistocerca piceifrons]|uniref:uncharacterized protein LOC124795569 n=1 Tax=Schistocerca piceifrons TaxID=274613 RepID=UPI001F5F273D|nr:uncharacterized protein LOC124795569 [Schistocerca piceifrons]